MAISAERSKNMSVKAAVITVSDKGSRGEKPVPPVVTTRFNPRVSAHLISSASMMGCSSGMML